jgi:aryl-phospho-beta-D-glucosidase BglC (GH1 family)
MTKTRKILGISILGLIGICILLNIALRLTGGHFSIMLPVEHKEKFVHDDLSQFPGRLQTRGSQIVDEHGKMVLLKGLMPPDPARLRSDGDFNQQFFAGMADAGANVIRIPVHPESWVRDPDYLWRYLDPIVAWAGESNMYVILDWHYIGNVATGAGPQMPDLDADPRDLTLKFWRSTARYFRDTPHVIFEIFNEPQSITAGEWQSSATGIIQAIRAQGAEQLVIVGGLDYGKDLSWVMEQPVEDENVAYASHIYPAHPRSSWQHWFGEVAGKYPVVITEWGFMQDNGEPSQAYLVGDQDSYGASFLNYLHEKNIGWVACWYDDQWQPPMFTEGREGYTSYGEFVIGQLKNTDGKP